MHYIGLNCLLQLYPIVILGIKPSCPETGFGYIETHGANNFVKQFIEKPPIEVAKALLQKNNVYWNSGVYLLEADKFANLIKSFQPAIYDILKNIRTFATQKDAFNMVYISEQYKTCESLSVDYGIIEKVTSDQIYMIEYNDIWSDIGSFQALHDIAQKDDNNINTNANVVNQSSNNCYVNSDRLVLLNNVSNLAIVDTKDTLLVTNLAASQEVKQIYETVKQKNKVELADTTTDYRPWGYFEVIAGSNKAGFKIKKLTVLPKQQLSLQSHRYRKEVWFCLAGLATVQVNDVTTELREGDMICININERHQLNNNADTTLVILEVQIGSYLGEDDIIRYQDRYNRVTFP